VEDHSGHGQDQDEKTVTSPGKQHVLRREVALVIVGSGIAFLGTCMGQAEQAYLARQQVAAAQTVRMQSEATTLFNEVSRSIGRVSVLLDKAAKAGIEHSPAFDSLAKSFEDASDAWRIEVPRYTALTSAYFDEDTAALYTSMSGFIAGGEDVLKAVSFLRKSRAEYDAVATGSRHGSRSALPELKTALDAAEARAKDEQTAVQAGLHIARGIELDMAFAIRDGALGQNERVVSPELRAPTEKWLKTNTLLGRMGVYSIQSWQWFLIIVWMLCGIPAQVRAKDRGYPSGRWAVTGFLLGPLSWPLVNRTGARTFGSPGN